MTGIFALSLDNFEISNTASPHEDTVWVYFTVKVGDTIAGPRHEKIGDRNNGTFPLHWGFTVEVEPDTPVLMTYQIVNHGHDDAQKQASDDITIAAKISTAVGTVVGVAFPPAAAVVGAITGALATAGEALKWIFGEVDCDCIILSDALTTDGNNLLGLTAAGVHTETRKYRGPDTPDGCGSNAEYAVTWSVTLVGES